MRSTGALALVCADDQKTISKRSPNDQQINQTAALAVETSGNNSPTVLPVSAPVGPQLISAARRWPSVRVASAFLDAALAAQRAGTLELWVRRHSRVQAWLKRELLSPIEGAQGSWADDTPVSAKCELLLRWALQALRPDGAAGLAQIPRAAWLEHTSWRPLLAVMCHHGFAPVPEFSDRYRRRPQEPAVDNLCGLWGIGPSSFYRYVDKGKRMLADVLLAKPLGGEQRLALREAAHAARWAAMCLDGAQPDGMATEGWHAEKARHCLVHRDPASALWHCLQAGDAEKFAEVVERFGAELAAGSDVDALLMQWQRRATSTAQEVGLLLATGHLWRHRKQDQRERECYEQGLRIASAIGDELLQGMAYSALGKYYEVRDADRSLGCYWDSIKRLDGTQRAGRPARRVEEQAKTLIRLAWLLLHKSDPQARTLLNRANALQGGHGLPDAVNGLLDKAWAEYWRRAGNIKLTLQHLQKALNTFERLDDLAQVFSTCNNLGYAYREAGEPEQAFRYFRKLIELADRNPIDPYDLAGVYNNLGANHFTLGQFDEAIAAYQSGLALAEASKLTSHVGRISYNLAEVHYKRFQLHGNPADESAGDLYVRKAHGIWEIEKNAAAHEATRSLKREILGPYDGQQDDRLVPEEFAAHFTELGEVQRHRATLAMPATPKVHAGARLAIARAYLAIAAQEREAALALIQNNGLGAAFEQELASLRDTFNRALAREERLAGQWREQAADLLVDGQRNAALAVLTQTGAINKSGYAQACGVSLATASKHLGLLAERGLLAQTGKGPATRYVLPGDEPPA